MKQNDLYVRPAGGFREALERIGHTNLEHQAALRCLEIGIPLPFVERALIVDLVDQLIARVEAAEKR